MASQFDGIWWPRRPSMPRPVDDDGDESYMGGVEDADEVEDPHDPTGSDGPIDASGEEFTEMDMLLLEANAACERKCEMPPPLFVPCGGHLPPWTVPTDTDPVETEPVAESLHPPPPSPAMSVQSGRSSLSRASSCRDPPVAKVELEYGHIAFYNSKRAFEARCSLHGDSDGNGCCLTRGGRPAEGTPVSNKLRDTQSKRPVAWLAAWLELVHSLNIESSEEHTHALIQHSIDFDRRVFWRHRLQDMPDGKLLMECERALFDGEAEEVRDVGTLPKRM